MNVFETNDLPDNLLLYIDLQAYIRLISPKARIQHLLQIRSRGFYLQAIINQGDVSLLRVNRQAWISNDAMLPIQGYYRSQNNQDSEESICFFHLKCWMVFLRVDGLYHKPVQGVENPDVYIFAWGKC